MSKTYEISYTETLSGTFTVEADSPEEAEEEFSRLANTGKIDFSDLEELEEDVVDAECVTCDDVPTKESPKPAPEEVLTAKGLPSPSRKVAFTSNGEVTFMGDFEKSLNAILLLTNGVKGNAKISWESSKTHGEISFAGELDGFAQTLLKLLADDCGTLSVSWTSQSSDDAAGPSSKEDHHGK